MTEDEEYDESADPCMQCGLCCKIYGDRISPTPTDLYTWMVNGNTDVLRYFFGQMSDGRIINCAALEPSDIGEIIEIGMRDPGSGGYLTVCPFLKRVADSRYVCSIHEIKPEMCCNFTPWERRQTDFRLCRALKR